MIRSSRGTCRFEDSLGSLDHRKPRWRWVIGPAGMGRWWIRAGWALFRGARLRGRFRWAGRWNTGERLSAGLAEPVDELWGLWRWSTGLRGGRWWWRRIRMTLSLGVLERWPVGCGRGRTLRMRW